MPQASLMTWLNKPKAVSEPQVPSRTDEAVQVIPFQAPVSPLVHNHLPKGDQPAEQQPKSDVKAAPLFHFPQRPLPANVELRACTKADIPHLKNLTGLLLPIPYPEAFYKEIIADPLTNNITLLAVWHDDPSSRMSQKGRLIGAIRCRLLARSPGLNRSKQADDGPMLYLSTLVLLSPYRSHGVASHLLQTLTRRAIDDYGVTSIGAHVWEANADALEWYHKRGFREVGREIGYYRRLDPQGAVVMQRTVSVMDVMGKRE